MTTTRQYNSSRGIDSILAQLDGLQWGGARGYAKCPAHDDRHRSLSLALGREQQLLAKCHAGCSFSDICKALGVEARDFFPTEASPLPKWMDRISAQTADEEIEAIHDYVGEDGRLLYQVVKSTGKQFRQRRPDGAVWVWNLEGVRKVLYRLPELIASPAEEPVLIVEGEKDVENLLALGLVATTGPGGAGKWQSEFADFLKGRDVVILPDNDAPGQNHAKLVFKALWGAARTIKMVALPGVPEKGDVSDWLAQPHENVVMELAALVAAEPYLEPAAPAGRLRWETAATLAGDPVVEPLIWPLVWPGAITSLEAAPKRGKTTLALAVVAAKTRGNWFLGRPVAGGAVVYLAEESAATFKGALARVGLGGAEHLHVLTHHGAAGVAWTEVCAGAAAKAAEVGAAMVVIDTLAPWAGLHGDAENAAGAAFDAISPLRDLADAGLAVLVLRHHRKGGGATEEAGRGSSAVAGGVDVIAALRSVEGGGAPTLRRLEFLGRFDNLPDQLVVEWDPEAGVFKLADSAKATEEEIKAKFLSTLSDGRKRTGQQLREETGADPQTGTGKRAMQGLLVRGQVTRSGEGRRGDPYEYMFHFTTSTPGVEAAERNKTNSRGVSI